MIWFKLHYRGPALNTLIICEIWPIGCWLGTGPLGGEVSWSDESDESDCSHHVAYVGCKTPASLGIMIIMIFRYMFMKPNQPKLNQDITCKVVFKHQESWFQSPVSLGGFPHRQAITSLLALFQLGLFSILLASTVKHASCSAGKCPNLLRDFTPWNVGFREDTGLLPLV